MEIASLSLPFHGIFWKFIFIYFERDREQAGEGQKEKETESQAGSALSAQSSTWGLNSQTLSQNQESTLNPLNTQVPYGIFY